VFVDATAFVAAIVESEMRHTDAVAVMQRLQEEGWHLYTIVPILGEAHALIMHELGTEKGAQFLAGTYASPATTIEPLGLEDEARALGLLRQYQDKSFSFVDALAFAVSERLGIRHAFSFDQHFRQYGRLTVLDGLHSW
jgi:predicted nucleic acid-binding protein